MDFKYSRNRARRPGGEPDDNRRKRSLPSPDPLRFLAEVLAASALAITSGCGLHADPSVEAANGDVNARVAVSGQRSQPLRITVPAGTPVTVRLNSALRTGATRPGDRFTGILAAPIVSGKNTIVPSGANVTGTVRTSQPSGRLKGRAVMSLALDSVQLKGRSIPVATNTLVQTSGRHRKRNLVLIGGGSGVGALIGGLAAGGAGALIGAGAGAAAGTVGAVFTGRKHTGYPAESVVVFRLRSPLRI